HTHTSCVTKPRCFECRTLEPSRQERRATRAGDSNSIHCRFRPASSAPTATTRTFSTITKGERPHPTWLPPLQSESKQTCGVCRCRTPREHGTIYNTRTTNTSCNTGTGHRDGRSDGGYHGGRGDSSS
ncbi:unnamed protein product, partial [Ectocarpus sp. 6 AP-2014]